jgi:hypothetical protein
MKCFNFKMVLLTIPWLLVIGSCGQRNVESMRHNQVSNALRQIKDDIQVEVETTGTSGGSNFWETVRTNILLKNHTFNSQKNALAGLWFRTEFEMWQQSTLYPQDYALVGSYVTDAGGTNFIGVQFNGDPQKCDLEKLRQLIGFKSVWPE